jgi:hypothetical protein
VPYKGQGPCQADQTDVAGIIGQQGPHLLTHRPWGVHQQSGIHCIGPGYLQEAHAEAEACSLRCHQPGLADHLQHLGPLPPALFTGPDAGTLLLVLACEGRSGGHPLGSVGRGPEKNHRRRVHNLLPAVVRALPKAY